MSQGFVRGDVSRVFSKTSFWLLNFYLFIFFIYFTKRTSSAPLHTLSKLYDVSVDFVYPTPSFEAVHCFICDRRRVAVSQHRMICLLFEYWKYGFRTFSLHVWTYEVKFCIWLCFVNIRLSSNVVTIRMSYTLFWTYQFPARSSFNFWYIELNLVNM